ncbi:MAG: hypothetical protein Q7T16_02055 [Candidatus Burarchaeum sp.]|nr:hypothetical protein [Candidatus Burarchaeum sp.]MDO8339417.1 hypothetical protein [Candidatus Burarchaeum sp.]
MKNAIIALVLLAVFGTAFADANMMGFSGSSPDNAAIQSQQQEEQEGKFFLDDLNAKTVVCSQLKDADFEKIGEYFMGLSIGDASRHIAMNEMMKSMMGEQGEEQMHIAMGKRMSNCEPDATTPQNMMNGGMMGSGMMGGSWQGAPYGMTGYGYPNLFGWSVFDVLLLILLLGLIVAVYLHIWGKVKKQKRANR